MELALSTRAFSYRGVRCLASSHKEPLFLGHSKPINLLLPRYPPSSTLVCSGRRNNRPAVTSISSKKKNKNIRPKKDDDDADDDFEDDPFEALFSLLEEDLKNDDSVVDDDEINEEDIDKLASELEVVLGDFDMEMPNTDTADTESDNDDAQEVVVAEEVQEEDVQDKEDDDDEEEEKQVRLKNWQLKKLAYALKIGRRKTNIKNLASELCLDRAVVLNMLRDPPPSLVMMSAALPDEPTPRVSIPEVKPVKTIMEEIAADTVEPETKVKEQVHARQRRWFEQKRLKKVQVETLELVYRRSKRPT
ncbi:protein OVEREXPRESSOR OF CATIONIC PEROXIDASE 3 isoform X3 [Mangifera indica]|nr:protein OVEREXPRESSOR OF CATIONIC PEROXIDASE 3 isoform X3 [Mangifera indica]